MNPNPGEGTYLCLFHFDIPVVQSSHHPRPVPDLLCNLLVPLVQRDRLGVRPHARVAAPEFAARPPKSPKMARRHLIILSTRYG